MSEIAQAIRIICKSRRVGGTPISLYGAKYHFKPETKADPKSPEYLESPHVAAIPFEDARQIYRLLSIRDTYELEDPKAELPPRPTPEKGQTIAGEKAISSADQVKKPIIVRNGEVEYNLAEMELADLVTLAKEELKIQVHHKWKEPTLIQKIVEAVRAAQGEPD